MAVDRVRPHFFEIDVGSDFVLDVFGRLRVRFGHRCSCELRRACQPRRLLQRLRAENAL